MPHFRPRFRSIQIAAGGLSLRLLAVIMWSTTLRSIMIAHNIDIIFLLTILLSRCGSSNSVHYPAPVYPGGVYSTLNQMQQVQATDHFDTMRFCERFMIDPIGGNYPNTLSFAHTKIMIRQHSAVMRCVIFSEMMALPHNIFQDFRRSITQIKREGVYGVKELILLPFKLVLTVSSVPFRILKAFLRLTSIFIKAHKEIYFNYG